MGHYVRQAGSVPPGQSPRPGTVIPPAADSAAAARLQSLESPRAPESWSSWTLELPVSPERKGLTALLCSTT
ncbi:unnamed protein product [Gadus morhua 'NCC']